MTNSRGSLASETMGDVGDISRGNILCKPRHYYEEPGKQTQEIPSIEGIL